MDSLVIKYEDFKKQIEEFCDNLQNLIESGINNIGDYPKYRDTLKNEDKKLLDFLKFAFNNDINYWIIEYNSINWPVLIEHDIPKSLANVKKHILEKINYLKYNLKLITVLDCVILKDKINLEQRKKYTTEEKLNLILEKLYILYDDNTYPIKELLLGNGIELKRHGEEVELIKILDNNGYINFNNLSNIMAQLTTEGAMYFEQLKKPYIEDYSNIPNSTEKINDKINQVIEKLTLLGFGQEIIFNEIDELRELYGKLNQKNWGELLKGKLIDLGLAQIINMDTIKEIFKILTDNQLKLN